MIGRQFKGPNAADLTRMEYAKAGLFEKLGSLTEEFVD